jgi:hypothetical protein
MLQLSLGASVYAGVPAAAWRLPEGFRLFHDDEMKIEFAYPRTWQLIVDCGEKPTEPCDITIIPPDNNSEPTDSEDEPLVPPGSVNIRLWPYSQWNALCRDKVQSPDRNGTAVTESRSLGMIREISLKTYSRHEYLGLGDGAQACLRDSPKNRMVVIEMRPPATPADPERLKLIRSFRFLDDSGKR